MDQPIRMFEDSDGAFIVNMAHPRDTAMWTPEGLTPAMQEWVNTNMQSETNFHIVPFDSGPAAIYLAWFEIRDRKDAVKFKLAWL